MRTLAHRHMEVKTNKSINKASSRPVQVECFCLRFSQHHGLDPVWYPRFISGEYHGISFDSEIFSSIIPILSSLDRICFLFPRSMQAYPSPQALDCLLSRSDVLTSILTSDTDMPMSFALLILSQSQFAPLEWSIIEKKDFFKEQMLTVIYLYIKA